MSLGFKRVGIALVKEYQYVCGNREPKPGGRVSEYGIYRSPGGKEYLQYEGYRENGWRVGLPLAGPNAAHKQPLIPLSKSPDIEKTYFEPPDIVTEETSHDGQVQA
jgi:hypothetical protein